MHAYFTILKDTVPSEMITSLEKLSDVVPYTSKSEGPLYINIYFEEYSDVLEVDYHIDQGNNQFDIPISLDTLKIYLTLWVLDKQAALHKMQEDINKYRGESNVHLLRHLSESSN